MLDLVANPEDWFFCIAAILERNIFNVQFLSYSGSCPLEKILFIML